MPKMGWYAGIRTNERLMIVTQSGSVVFGIVDSIDAEHGNAFVVLKNAGTAVQYNMDERGRKRVLIRPSAQRWATVSVSVNAIYKFELFRGKLPFEEGFTSAQTISYDEEASSAHGEGQEGGSPYRENATMAKYDSSVAQKAEAFGGLRVGDKIFISALQQPSERSLDKHAEGLGTFIGEVEEVFSGDEAPCVRLKYASWVADTGVVLSEYLQGTRDRYCLPSEEYVGSVVVKHSDIVYWYPYHGPLRKE